MTGTNNRGFSGIWIAGNATSCFDPKSDQNFAWLPIFLNKDMVSACFLLHHRLRSILLELNFPTNSLLISSTGQSSSLWGKVVGVNIFQISRTIIHCLSSLSQMLVSFSSVDVSIIFPNHTEKSLFGETLLCGAIKYVEMNVGRLEV
jgi:hypothetical protein